MVEAVWHGVFMVLGWSVNGNNMHLIIHLLSEYFPIPYQVSITRPFTWATMSRGAFALPFIPTDQTSLEELNLDSSGQGNELTPSLFSPICSKPHMAELKKDLSFLVIKRRKWARMPRFAWARSLRGSRGMLITSVTDQGDDLSAIPAFWPWLADKRVIE